MAEQAKATKAASTDEITLKFGKGCVGDPFTAKDGKQYVQILIPNQDPFDSRPWQTFVMRENQVHENQYGKGMWCKLPADGNTTVQRNVAVGKDAEGKTIWQTQRSKVSNRDLKKMVEAYKERPRESALDQLSKPSKSAAAKADRNAPARKAKDAER